MMQNDPIVVHRAATCGSPQECSTATDWDADRMRNLACKVPEELWPEFKVQAHAAHRVHFQANARDPPERLGTECGRPLPGRLQGPHRPSVDAGEPQVCDPDDQLS